MKKTASFILIKFYSFSSFTFWGSLFRFLGLGGFPRERLGLESPTPLQKRKHFCPRKRGFSKKNDSLRKRFFLLVFYFYFDIFTVPKYNKKTLSKGAILFYFCFFLVKLYQFTFNIFPINKIVQKGIHIISSLVTVVDIITVLPNITTQYGFKRINKRISRI